MIEALISAHRRLIILSIFRHEIVALIELLCFYAPREWNMAGEPLKLRFTQDTHVSKLLEVL